LQGQREERKSQKKWDKLFHADSPSVRDLIISVAYKSTDGGVRAPARRLPVVENFF
jgi:hypothetical protein